MILSAHHFGSHVARSSTCVSAVVGLDYPCDTQIGGSKVTLVIKDQVLRLDISVDDVVEVEILKTDQNGSDEEFCFHLLEAPSAAHMVAEISSDQEIHDEVEVLSVLEGVGHVDDERMFQL